MTLRVRLVSAQLSHDTELLSNMDPYCFLQLGSQRFRSKTKQEAGKKPVWNEQFQFTASDNQLKITVMDQDTFNDDLVGEGTINIAQYRNRPNEQQQIVQLYYHGRTAGKVFLSISGGATQNAWGQNSVNNTWGQNSMNGYNQGNQPYNQPNFNQPYSQPNSQPYNQPVFTQAYNQWQQQNQPSWNSQGNMPPPASSPWGDLNRNNGWGDFNPSNPSGTFSNPNIPPPNQNVNPMALIGGFFNQNNQTPPQNYGGSNPYGNPYK